MRKKKAKKLLAVMLTMSLCVGSLSTKIYARGETDNDFDKYENVNVTFITEISFTDKQAKEYEKALEKDLRENVEQLENDLLRSNNETKSKAIKKQIELISNVDTSEVFNGDEDNTIVIPMKGIEVDCSVIDDLTDEDGEVEVKADDMEELVDWCDEQDVELYQDDEGLVVKSEITAEEFAEGGLKMSEDMLDAEGQKVVTVKRVKYNKSNPKIWGKNYSSSRLIYSTKSYPNIVHCNKCDDSSSENEKNVGKWLLDGSDCAKAIRLGTISLTTTNPILKLYYSQNVVCVIESCQNLSGKEGPNVYCNSKKKSGPHWNCSWFNGIKHTESFHYHK